jgi:hypothetical protein
MRFRPLAVDMRFRSADCDLDLAVRYRFPCGKNTSCSLNLTEFVTNCGGVDLPDDDLLAFGNLTALWRQAQVSLLARPVYCRDPLFRHEREVWKSQS